MDDGFALAEPGVIVLDGSVLLAEGTRVFVTIPSPLIKAKASSRHVEFPLVHDSNPGSVHLTNEMIGEILNEEDAAQIL